MNPVAAITGGSAKPPAPTPLPKLKKPTTEKYGIINPDTAIPVSSSQRQESLKAPTSTPVRLLIRSDPEHTYQRIDHHTSVSSLQPFVCINHGYLYGLSFTVPVTELESLQSFSGSIRISKLNTKRTMAEAKFTSNGQPGWGTLEQPKTPQLQWEVKEASFVPGDLLAVEVQCERRVEICLYLY